ncbi:MAG TPA: hypothetical protein ENK21_06720 [Trueperaceae bacterium]|nr:hypothetical protein [Trueperaceae bacterium]
MKIIWSKASLFFLFMIAFIGSSLRAVYFIKLPLKYQNLIHAHSHTAFQGWIYTLTILLISSLYLSQSQIKKGRYPLQFWLTVLVIVGVLVSFSLQGYGLFSIIFSTIFGFMNYWFIFGFLRQTKDFTDELRQSISLHFIKTGLWLGLLSSLLPFGIGFLAAKDLKATEAYPSLIYTFLHLQYNGWFLFVALGLFFKLLENAQIPFSKKMASRFYLFFAIAVLPAISLSFLGTSFRNYIILPAYFAAIMQIIGLGFFFLTLKPILKKWMCQKNIWFKLFISASLVSFFLKISLQSLSILPQLEQYAFKNKNVVLAYLHLSLIGVLSFMLIAILIDLKWLSINWLSKIGLSSFLAGFVITELILALGGLGIFYDYKWLFYGSVAMLIGISLLLISPHKNHKSLTTKL